MQISFEVKVSLKVDKQKPRKPQKKKNPEQTESGAVQGNSISNVIITNR
jgi:hypothetical protein